MLQLRVPRVIINLWDTPDLGGRATVTANVADERQPKAQP